MSVEGRRSSWHQAVCGERGAQAWGTPLPRVLALGIGRQTRGREIGSSQVWSEGGKLGGSGEYSLWLNVYDCVVGWGCYEGGVPRRFLVRQEVSVELVVMGVSGVGEGCMDRCLG